MTKKIYISLIFIILIHNIGKPQNNRLFFDFSSGGGKLLPHPKMQNLAGAVTFFNARVGLKTLGQKEWQRIYHYPQLGIGVSQNYLTTRSLGNPTAIYSFLNLPLLTMSPITINMGMHCGVSWGFNPYKEQYPQDVVIGSKLAVYSSLSLNSSFPISRQFEILLALEAYHLSNGNTNKPNKGINMIGAEAGVRYILSNSSAVPNNDRITLVEKSWSVILFGAWSRMRESTSYTSKSTVGSLSAGLYQTLNQKSRLSAGVDLFYDEGDLVQLQKVNQLKNVLAAGLFGGHELTIDKLSIVTQLGVYIRNPCSTDPLYYERVGLRYMISRRFIPSFTIKVHGVDVDFAEFGMGFVLWNSINRKINKS